MLLLLPQLQLLPMADVLAVFSFLATVDLD